MKGVRKLCDAVAKELSPAQLASAKSTITEYLERYRAPR